MIFLILCAVTELEYSYLIYQKMYLTTFSGIKQFYKGVPFHPLPHKIFEGKACKFCCHLLDTKVGEAWNS